MTTPTRRSTRPHVPVLLLLAAATAALAGCSAAQDAAGQAAGQAQAAASAKASQAVVALVTAQVCRMAQDGLTAAEVSALEPLMAKVRATGVPSPVLTRAQQILDRGAASADQVASLKRACAGT